MTITFQKGGAELLNKRLNEAFIKAGKEIGMSDNDAQKVAVAILGGINKKWKEIENENRS